MQRGDLLADARDDRQPQLAGVVRDDGRPELDDGDGHAADSTRPADLGQDARRGTRSARHRLRALGPEGRDPGGQARQARRGRGAPRPRSAASRSTRGRSRRRRSREAVLDQLARAPARRPRPDRAWRRPSSQALQQLMDRAARVVCRGDRGRCASSSGATWSAWLAGQRAVFEDDHTVTIERLRGADPRRADRDRGRDAARAARTRVAFDDRTIVDSDGLLKLERRVPRTMTIVGAGVIGVEYASMFGALGTKVTRRRPARPHARLPRRRDRRGVPVPPAAPQRDVPAARAASRRSSPAGRERARVKLAVRQGDRQRDRALRGRPPGRDGRPGARARPGSRPTSAGGSRSTTTSAPRVPHIFAVGDVAGGGLAATAMEQGRIAALHAFGQPVDSLPALVPTGRLRDPRDRHGRVHRGGADRRVAPVRRRHRALDASSRAG